MTDNMLDDNVLGSVDNQENVEAHHEREHDPRRRRRRDTVLHQPQPNINQVSCVPGTDSWSHPMLPLSATCVFVQAVGNFGGVLTTMFLYRFISLFSLRQWKYFTTLIVVFPKYLGCKTERGWWGS